MKTNEPIILSRDCEAIQIPSGENIMLPAGSQVTVTQSLGGSYTVTTDQGYLVRIANKDADAIGKEAEASQAEKLTPIRQKESSHMRSCTACSTSGPAIGRTALTTLEVSF